MFKTIRLPAIMYREFELELGERAEGEKEGRYAISFSSELPVLRHTWDGSYYEILSHKADDVDLSRAKNGLAALKTHDQLSHFGSVDEIKLDRKDRVLRGMLGCSSIALGQEQKTLIDEGHLHTVSVGYRVTEMDLLKKSEEGGYPTMLCKWIPLEVSTAPVPADPIVGIGRALGEDGADGEIANTVTVQVRGLTTEGGEERMAKPIKDPAAEAPVEEIRVVEDVNTRDYGKEAAEIAELCATNKMAERAAEWIRAKMTPGEVATQILATIRTAPKTPPPSEVLEVMDKKDRSAYSITRALRIQTEMKAGDRSKYDGLEAEVHQELASHRVGSDHGGICVPWDTNPERKRILGTGEPAGGATLVDTTHMPEMIDILKNRAIVLAAGARFYPGLTNVIHFNKKTGVPTVHWMEENPTSGATTSTPAFGYVELAPKTLIGNIIMPRQLTTMSSYDVEADVRADLGSGHALAIDLGALHGSGTAKQPEGIYSAAGVQTKTFGGVPDYAKMTDMGGLLADANADLGDLSYVTTPLMASKMKQTPVVSAQAIFVWTGNFREGEMCGYPAHATNQISKVLGTGSDHGIIFGNWSDLMVGMWGNDLELVVDPYKYADKGQIQITSFSMADTAVRRGASFVKALTAVIA